MKAVVIESYGGREVLQVKDLPMPTIGSSDVLIETHAASVNPVDWKIREGYLKERIHYDFPLILGWDLAGVVTEVGDEVTKFKPGDAVFSRPATERNGSYAEYVAVDENLVAKMPSNLTYEEAASIPLAGLTAWQALVNLAGLQANQKVLIHAGAGGVGVYAVQLAKALGAHVATTTSSHNVDFVKSLGVDEVIDYTKTDIRDVLKDYDAVFDTIGADVQKHSFDVLKKDGYLVSIVSPPSEELAREYGVRVSWFFLQPDGQELAELGKLFADGRMKPVVGKVFDLEEVKEAHELSETGHARGKIVLQVRK